MLLRHPLGKGSTTVFQHVALQRLRDTVPFSQLSLFVGLILQRGVVEMSTLQRRLLGHAWGSAKTYTGVVPVTMGGPMWTC